MASDGERNVRILVESAVPEHDEMGSVILGQQLLIFLDSEPLGQLMAFEAEAAYECLRAQDGNTLELDGRAQGEGSFSIFECPDFSGLNL